MGNLKLNLDQETIRPCQWDKYAKGKVTPGPELIERVNIVFRGSANLINHPIWEYFRETPPDDRSMQITLGKIRPHLMKYVGLSKSECHSYPFEKESTFESISSIKPLDLMDRHKRPFQSLIVLLTILVDGENKQYHRQFMLALRYFLCIMPIVINESSFVYAKQSIYLLVIYRFVRRKEVIEELNLTFNPMDLNYMEIITKKDHK